MKRWLILFLVIAVLLALGGFWALPRAVFDGRGESPVRAAVQGLVIALKSFQVEYGKLPLEAIATADEHIPRRTRGAILLVLLGKDSKINPRKIVFYDPPVAKNKKNGLFYDANNEPILVDPWGEPLYFVLDLNGDGKIPNPDPRPDQPRELTTDIIVFSAGPDRDPNTWKDNITSW